MEEYDMKKLGYVIAALGAIAIAAPSIASAKDIVVKHGERDNMRAHAEFRGHRDHGWHRDHGHHDKIVIRHRHHEG
jgi:hypothetical protein